MRVRVKFRYRADTGEVEMYEVEDIGTGPRVADHDARHDRVTAALARLVEDHALIEEVYGATGPPRRTVEPASASVPEAEERRETRQERRDRD
ncbi:hypothetical protein ACH4SP_28220 [Streptomyces sp. NPDC021093]|uniref:hypothetical protein n=1 Tax=Streptomyces sp. NPDC021093 TaxID=3365112 RepID=UPI003788FFCE